MLSHALCSGAFFVAKWLVAKVAHTHAGGYSQRCMIFGPLVRLPLPANLVQNYRCSWVSSLEGAQLPVHVGVPAGSL